MAGKSVTKKWQHWEEEVPSLANGIYGDYLILA